MRPDARSFEQFGTGDVFYACFWLWNIIFSIKLKTTAGQ